MCYSNFKQLKRYDKPTVTEYSLTPAARLLTGSPGMPTGLPEDPTEWPLP